MPQEKSSGAVVFREEGGRRLYLLLHYEAKHWDFTKGHVEKGENDEQTARRECEEETGIRELTIIPGFREMIEYFYKNKEKIMHKQVVFLLARTRKKEVTLSFEHIGFEWLPYEEALGRLTYDNAKNVLRKAESFLVDSS
jgi:8-oxo-dGTP pyrophosphatase MutT (NUDIX family)